MGIGFCAVGLIKGVSILTSENGGGIGALLDGVGFFLLAGTGIAMLMDRFYSLYLLLLWAALGIAGSFIAQGELSLQLPALFARIMVGLVALVAIGQRGAPLRRSGQARRRGIAVSMARRRNAAGADAAEDEFRRIYDSGYFGGT